MPTIKEFKQFFLRNKVTSGGNTPDQEANYPVTTTVKGTLKGNRFLANHAPTQNIFEKLFESITFKLNKEDTATSTIQGLVKKATDIEAESRTLNPDTDFTKALVPHQLPDIVLASDGSDAVVGSPVTVGGLTLTTLKRTLTGGRTKRNYLLQVPTAPEIQSKYLRANFPFNTTTLAVVTASGIDLSATVQAGLYYTFEILLLFNVDATSSIKFALAGTATITEMQIFTHGQYTFTELIITPPYENSLSSPAPTGNRCTSVKGSFRVATDGTFQLHAATASGGSAGNVLKGTYLKVTKV